MTANWHNNLGNEQRTGSWNKETGIGTIGNTATYGFEATIEEESQPWFCEHSDPDPSGTCLWLHPQLFLVQRQHQLPQLSQLNQFSQFSQLSQLTCLEMLGHLLLNLMLWWLPIPTWTSPQAR